MNEHYSRLQTMLLDDRQTWDLSPNDKQAIRWALGMINCLANELAGYDGTTVPSVMKRYGAIVEKGGE